MTTPDPRVSRWLQENQRPARPPDAIYRRRMWVPIGLALLVGIAMAIANAPHTRSAPDPSPYVPVRITAVAGTTSPGDCNLRVRDGRGDTGTLHRQPCQPRGSTTFAYLNSRGTLQVSPPLKRAHGIMRDVFAGVIWFGIVLPFFALVSWLVSWRMLRRRHGRPRPKAPR